MAIFGLRQSERTYVFIDGPNLYAASKHIGCDIDYRALSSQLAANSELVRSIYYTSILDNDDEHITIKPLIDYLDYNGFKVVTKTARDYVDSVGRRKIKGSMIADIVVDMMKAAHAGAKHIVLFSGDGEFTTAILAVQDYGVRTTVVSTTQGATSMASDDLRRAADVFIELKDAMNLIGRAPAARRTPVSV